jgi:protein arginine kinase
MTSLINKAVKAITEIGLAVKGFFSDNMTSLGDVYQISNQLAIGQSESEIIDNLLKVAGPLINYERRAREEVLSKRRVEIEDSVYRALGILTNCRTIGIREAIELLSRVRLGISLDLIKNVDFKTVTYLFFITQKSHIQRLADEKKEKVDIKLIDYMRAKIIRDRIKIRNEGSESDV